MKKYLFHGDYPLSHFFELRRDSLKRGIYNFSEDEFLKFEEPFIEHCIMKESIKQIVVDWNSLDKENTLGSEMWNANINIGHIPGTMVPVVYVKYFVKHNGQNFNNIFSHYSLQYEDDQSIMWGNSFDGDHIKFNIYAYGSTNLTDENKNKIVQAKEKAISIIKNNVAVLNSHIEIYNSSLRAVIENIVQKRKEEIEKHNAVMQGL